jgi:hypothetical protein
LQIAALDDRAAIAGLVAVAVVAVVTVCLHVQWDILAKRRIEIDAV